MKEYEEWFKRAKDDTDVIFNALAPSHLMKARHCKSLIL